MEGDKTDPGGEQVEPEVDQETRFIRELIEESTARMLKELGEKLGELSPEESRLVRETVEESNAEIWTPSKLKELARRSHQEPGFVREFIEDITAEAKARNYDEVMRRRIDESHRQTRKFINDYADQLIAAIDQYQEAYQRGDPAALGKLTPQQAAWLEQEGQYMAKQWANMLDDAVHAGMENSLIFLMALRGFMRGIYRGEWSNVGHFCGYCYGPLLDTGEELIPASADAAKRCWSLILTLRWQGRPIAEFMDEESPPWKRGRCSYCLASWAQWPPVNSVPQAALAVYQERDRWDARTEKQGIAFGGILGVATALAAWLISGNIALALGLPAILFFATLFLFISVGHHSGARAGDLAWWEFAHKRDLEVGKQG